MTLLLLLFLFLIENSQFISKRSYKLVRITTNQLKNRRIRIPEIVNLYRWDPEFPIKKWRWTDCSRTSFKRPSFQFKYEVLGGSPPN